MAGIPKAKFYGLDGQLISIEEWGNLMVSGKKILAQDNVGDYLVSTALLGVDLRLHIHEGTKPIIFETIVFKDGNEEYIERYYTKEEAFQGHKDAIKMMEVAVRSISRRHSKGIDTEYHIGMIT